MITDEELAQTCHWVTGGDERHVAVTDDGWRLALCGLASPARLYPRLDRFLRGS